MINEYNFEYIGNVVHSEYKIKKLPGTKTTLSLRSGKIMPLMCTTQFTLNLLSRYLELIKKANKQLINKYLGMLIGNF
ncbi:hypothetical protein GJ496_005227 [Pomphorhynchus laevis]|nr:hypothetical protein GJ496_005227 [Pomphorhynchus laevis]